jgi:hypothetical protein
MNQIFTSANPPVREHTIYLKRLEVCKMENQIEYQRNVIREEYVNESEINQRIENLRLERFNRSLQRGEPPGARRVEKTMGIALPEDGIK